MQKPSVSDCPIPKNPFDDKFSILIYLFKASFTLASKLLHLGSELLAASSDFVPTILQMPERVSGYSPDFYVLLLASICVHGRINSE